jgi:hypothetical protein
MNVLVSVGVLAQRLVGDRVEGMHALPDAIDDGVDLHCVI